MVSKPSCGRYGMQIGAYVSLGNAARAVVGAVMAVTPPDTHSVTHPIRPAHPRARLGGPARPAPCRPTRGQYSNTFSNT